MNWIFMVFFLLLTVRSGTAQDVEQGSDSEALIYSIHHKVIVLAVCFGSEVDQDKRTRVIDYVENNIFKGVNEAPLKYFTVPDVVGEGVLTNVFIKGDTQVDPISNQYIFNITELKEKASVFVGVFNLLHKRGN
ncbi:MAG: hypothetical protein HKN92_10175 [Chitinophagales bacterium]|nr:hypothetical protein [Chitinophagales bacterium]